MRVGDKALQLFYGEVLGEGAGGEIGKAAVHGVGARGERRERSLEVAGRGKQLYAAFATLPVQGGFGHSVCRNLAHLLSVCKGHAGSGVASAVYPAAFRRQPQLSSRRPRRERLRMRARCDFLRALTHGFSK